MPTFFFRQPEFKGAPKLELARLVAALLHLSIPVLMYQFLWHDFGHDALSRLTPISDLSADRKRLYIILDVYYSVRWAIGMMIMQGDLTMSIGIFVSAKHLLFDECGYILGSSLVHSWGYRSGPLTTFDYICAGLMFLAGILQHGSELQRWRFKLDPQNKGKIHTGGLFSFARGINHTGHMLRDLAHVMLSPN